MSATSSGLTASSWLATSQATEFSPVTEESGTDVCAIGAGIAGLTTSYMLLLAGEWVTVLDDGLIGGGGSGRTTAHLSSAVDTGYALLEQVRGGGGDRPSDRAQWRSIHCDSYVSTPTAVP